ncbi:MAG: hypothetical protein ACI305_07285 [Lepagella sp.]
MKIRRLLFAAALLLTACAANAQWGVGIRDTRYINVNYTFADRWRVKLEHSVYSENLKDQYVRLYMAYTQQLGRFTLSGEPYFGMTYKNTYRSLGFNIDAEVRILRWLFAGAGFTPHYDSGLGYKSLYKAFVGFDCTKNIALMGTFTNRPEYREPEKRIRGGVRFSVGRLWVLPEVSVPVGDGSSHSLRFMASMGYSF